MSGLFLRIFLAFMLVSACKTRFFQDGFEHYYVYKAQSDFLGMHNVTTIIKFHVQRQNLSKAGDQLNNLWLDSFVQFSQAGQYAENPLKWKLSRPFLFTVSPKGIVLHVHVHPEEQDEVSALKKVISSTFSANVLIKNDTQWTYTSTDSDHIGTLEHEYTGTRTGTGIRLSRYHRSVKHVERIHAKTMHLDKYGTVESVEGEDSIILENRLDSDFETKRIPYPEEYVIKTTEEGDIDVIKANAVITVKLLSKRRSRQNTENSKQYHGLRLDKVLYPQTKIQKNSLASLEKHIKAAIDCSHQYSDKSNTNRTICVNNLRQNVTALNEADYESLVTEFLSKDCEQNNTKCEGERLLFTDIVAREGDELSQRLVLRYLFQGRTLDEEAIRRALIHFTTLEKPIWETVSAVEKLCFGKDNEHHGSIKMALTVQRSCLALGVLAKALNNNGNETAASDILEKLHTWLYEQGDETPEHLRPRRSTINVDTSVSSDHLLSKFVLLHSLGNAAQPSSLPHLHEYARPNSRIPAWRRAALTAMKYDKGEKTAQVLLDSLTYDNIETVRATAMEQFLAHPLQHNFTKSVGDILLSQNYSYPTVVRLKRAGDLNAVLLEFKVELPEVHWGKSVGNAKIGASFGVDMVNRMHLRLKALSGFFHINIWDRVYAEAHVGILGLRIDILRIEACYRGKLEYNLNILKDFSYGEAQRDFDEYDEAAGAIVSPIVTVVEGITEHFRASSGHQGVFQPLEEAVKDIPAQARRFLDSSLALLSVLDSYQGIPLVSRAKLLAFKVQGLAEDIKADTLNFYNEIADTALIVLPHAETQIKEAANMIVDAQKKLGSNPKQAFETINKAKQRIKYATYQIIKAKSVLQDALSPHGGSLPTWISSQEEIKMAISASQTLLTDIKSSQAYFASVAKEEVDHFVNGHGLADIQKAVERVAVDMKNLNAGVKPFHVVVTDTLKKMQEIKLSVDELDKTTKETQNNVKKSFGPKFNIQFPAQRREPDGKCGRGIWPSTTGGRYNDIPGIDVIVEERSKVVCPVNGKVFRTCKHDEVRIVPSDDNFKMFTIFVMNIRLEDSTSAEGSEFKGGQTLGYGKGKNGCGDPYIHVAMRKDSENGASECSFVDPSSYVDNIKPFPKWQEECKEFVFKHIGHIIEAGLSGLGFEDIVEELAQRAMAWAGADLVQKVVSKFPKSQMAKIAGTMAFAYLSQYNSEIANVFMKPESQNELMDKKCEEMKQATTTPSTTGVHKPKESISAGNEEVSEMIRNLKANTTSMQKSIAEIEAVVEKLKGSATGIQLDDMSSMAFSKYGKILHKLNIPYKGSKQSMETTLQMLTWNVCPTFENGIAQGYGHLCMPTDDCFGLNCTIRIPHGIKKDKVALGVLFNRSDLTFTLFTRNNATQIVVNGYHKEYHFPNMMPNYDVTVLSYANSVNVSVGQAIQLTLSAILCENDARCLPEIHIFKSLTFLKHQQRRIRSSGDGCSLSAEVGIENVGHIGGSLEVDKNGHVSGGGVDLGVKAGDVEVSGGFNINDQGEWGVNVGADVDFGDGKTIGTDMYLEGNGDGLTFGLGVEAKLGETGSIGGFVEGNTDGEFSAGMHGNINLGTANVSAGGWLHHDKNGTSGGGSVAANFGSNGHVEGSVNRSANGAIDAALGGGVNLGNTTISAGGHIHHDRNGTSGGAQVAANFNGRGQIGASVNASSDGTVDAGISGSAQIGNSTISGAGYLHHDKNGTSGGGAVAANIDGKGQIGASLNASSDGTIDARASGSAQIGNSTISGAGYVHHDKNGTSGGGVVAANIDGKGQIAASLNASSDGTIDAGASGSAQIGNSTIAGAGYVHHDKNGTSGGGVVAANIDGKGQIGASLNASSDGTIDAGASGSAQIRNSTISGAGYVHHDKNGTSGGGVVAANIDGKGQIAASLNASSDGTIDAGASGSAQIGNSTISGAGYLHHDNNGTSGGGAVAANIDGKGQIAASLNASSDGTIDAGASGSAQIGNSTIAGAGYVHHDKNGTSGGGVVAANIDGKGEIGASLNASSDGTIDAGASGSAQIGNSTISGAGYLHHDKNGTSGGGAVAANIDGKGQIGASLNASSDGTIDAGASGSAQIGNSTIAGAGYVHHDKNGTSGGGVVAANIDGKGQIGASLNASSDGTIDAGASGSAQIGNSTISGAGYVHHDKNGTVWGGEAASDIDDKGRVAASLNSSSDGAIDARLGGVHIGKREALPMSSVSHTFEADFVNEEGAAIHHVNSRSVKRCSVGLSATIGNGQIGIGAEANIPGFGKLGAHATIKDGQLQGEIDIGDFSFDLGDVQKLTMDTFNQFATDLNINSDTTGVMSGFRDGMKHQVCTSETEMTVEFDTESYEEDFPARDRKDGVVYKDKHIDITIFKISHTFGIGPIGIKLEFGAGGAIGTDMWSDIHANKGTAAFSIGPWVSGMVWGGLSIELGIASGGIKLIGYILKTKFPVTMETKSNKHPLTVVMNIDLELTPIELSLRGWAKVFFAKVFDKCLWKWACPPITWNILRKELENKDKVPPQFVTGSFCGDYRGKRAVSECFVRQIPNRHPTDAAFQLEVSATDDDSSVKTWYAIGRSQGGRDVQGWTKFKGDNQVIPCKLPNGVPLYFTIKAQNQQGLESFLQCKLNTYDNTLPDGRVEESHKFSSHTGTISATVIVNDDSPITSSFKALGLSPGQYGREIDDWNTLPLSKTTVRSGVSSDMKHFSFPRKGKLIVHPLETAITRSPEICSRKCLDSIKCLSFDYEQTSETCQLYDVVESHANKLHTKGDFHNYERLGGGFVAFVEYKNQALEHGTVYYVNALIENSLKYRSALFSEGTLIDFTPPETGYLGNVSRDITVSHRCKASVRQRCEEVTDLPNHRIVIDGQKGRTVFNGNKPLLDTKYTLTNHYVTANWDGFSDAETGIWGFAWAVGTKVCGQDIVPYEDPHGHISSPKYWTYSGFHEGVTLQDGEYYVTVEALNNVVFGGALVTTVCRSVPFTVDTTPPYFYNITDVMFDEDFDILAAYYNVSDEQSGISRVDFGLGLSKHDVGLRAYSRHGFMDRSDPYLVIEDLELQPGIPAWVRLRAVNKVGLFASGHADAPIMVDKTPPVPGTVLDGNILKEDIKYQHDTDTICAQWVDFFDPESGIKRFIWGVGSRPELDDVVAFRNISKFERHACAAAHLQHYVTYFSTVIALNDALNSKRSNSSSDGVLVDVTPPLAGKVEDRNMDSRFTKDIDYTSETATVAASWYNFTDPESGIDHFDINIEINNETTKSLHMSNGQLFQDHSLTLQHLDFIKVKVSASNGAKLQTNSKSDGALVDHTPPNLHYIYDTKNDKQFQPENTTLYLKWQFSDPESGIAEYRYKVEEIDAGIRTTIFPENGEYTDIVPESEIVSVKLDKLHLKDGALYKVHISAINKARLSSSHESEGVLVDTTPPIVKNIKLAMPKEEEDLDETDSYVLHAESDSLTVSWLARDSESGIKTMKVGIGLVSGDTSITKGYLIFDDGETHASLSDLNMRYYTEELPILYYVSVIAVNKAGLASQIATSKPIKILHENVPGTVYDGRQDLQDSDFTRDKTSLGISFAGFESETCNIVGYEWAVGSKPYLTDFLPFTDYGIVMVNKSKGHAQISLELYDSLTYYATVRARTGQMCKQEFIMSVSDGITLDSKGPDITLNLKDTIYRQQEITHQKESVYQKTTDNIDISWSAADISGIGIETWRIGSLPKREDIHNETVSKANAIPLKSISLYPGKANFVTVSARDKAGNLASLTSPAVVADTSVPEVKGFSCTKVLSSAESLLGCEWSMISDSESPIISLSFGISSTPLGLEILNFTEISVEQRSWYRNIADVITETDVTKIYMSLRILNGAGQQFISEKSATVDRTPPFGGTIQFVTQDSLTLPKTKKLCQISEQYVEIEVDGFVDKESGISRYEIGLGSHLGKTDILKFTEFDIEECVFIDGLQLISGMTVFASIKVYNNVNLYNTSFSHGIVISPSPELSIFDGNGYIDQDYLSQMNIIQGRWKYTDPCPIISADWSVEDLAGNTVQKFKPIIDANTYFLNDELRTENGKTYINIIRTTDALNRTRLSRSDGITVRIQPPTVSIVRDGLESEDINYQRSISELSGNWNEFGDISENNPSQIILKYEAAIGNDRRFPNTRTNVHPFVDIGMNRTITFKNLKLKSKLVRYYVTVRAYSAAGSFVEGYSNGVRVGYEEIVKPGELKYKEFQSFKHRIDIGWSDFVSDYGIRHYEIAVGTAPPNTTNDTVDCNVFKSKVFDFDIRPMSNVGLNTFTRISGVSLLHGKRYFVTVLAEDESGSCIAVSTGPILIDTSRPTIGNIFLNDVEIGKHYNFINDSHLRVSWKNCSDNESGILSYHVQLAEKFDCSPKLNIDNVVQEQLVNITEVNFYQLKAEKKYIVTITVTNGANLSISTSTPTIFLDEKRPLIGQVKAGVDWHQSISVQKSLTTLNATILIARSRDGYTCPLQSDISPNSKNLFTKWHPLADDFVPECVSIVTKGLRIEVKTDEHIFSEIVKGGVQTNEMEVLEGTYTFRMKGLRGDHMVSSVSILREISTIPFQFSDALADVKESSDFYNNNTSSDQPQKGLKSISTENRYGAGFLIPGYRISNDTTTWNILFWAADMYNLQLEWISTDFNPTDTEAKYDLDLRKNNDTKAVTWKIVFSVNDIEKATINTLTFQNKCKISVLGYNKDGFVPDIVDIFSPFYSEILVHSVFIPSLKMTPCRYGKPFYDDEGGISEIWAGVSNSQNETETIMPYALQKRFCLPCNNKCPTECDPDCSLDVTYPQEVLPITLSDLSMLPSSNTSHDMKSNISSGSDFSDMQTESYYINVKVVDFAGNSEEVMSRAIIVDNTPPNFIQLSCVDPVHSMDEPALYQGTNSSVAAFWDCEDDISQIKSYTACVGTSAGNCDVSPVVNVGLQTSVVVDGLNGLLLDGYTYFLTVTAYNAADMKTNESCNITVELQSPVTKHSESKEMFSLSVTNALPNVAFSDRTDRLGIHWESKNNDTEFFEWEIGSSSTKADIFPRVKIGTKHSKKAAVIDGHLWLDDVNINTTVKEYVLTNWTEEEIYHAKTHGHFFNFEPGRCIHVNLYSVNRAHLSSKIPVKPICMKRKDDMFINFEKQTLQKLTTTGTSLKMVQPGSTDKDMDLMITLNGSSGGLLVGLLGEKDLNGMFGSSASDSYRPYIASPRIKTKTSRLLRKRFQHYSGMSFYVSPTGNTQLNDMIDVSIHFNNTDHTSIPTIVYWDQVKEEWRKVTEDCKTEEHINYINNMYTAKVCMPSQSSHTERLRRSLEMSSNIDGPRQFSLVFISKEVTQTRPTIETTSLTYNEDEATIKLKVISVFDAEDDNVTFRLIGSPRHGFANISANGKLYYKPDADFSGNDEVTVACIETSLPRLEKPQPVQATIKLFVTEVNDAPDLLFVRANETFTGDRNNKIIIPMESNATGYFIGTFFASDIDLNDNLTAKVFDSSSSEVNLTLSKTDDISLIQRFQSIYNKESNTVYAYHLDLSMSNDFFGVIEYGLIIHDNAGHWSLPIKLTIGILYNPCVYGQCAPNNKLQCTDLVRAKSFDSFKCECQAGYEGRWCETETNECGPEPCALMFDCEDLVAGFRCNINIPKLMAILVCSLLAIGAVCFVIYRKKEQLNKKMKVSNMDLRNLSSYRCSPIEHFSGKYGHNPFEDEHANESDGTGSDTDSGDKADGTTTDGETTESNANAKSAKMLDGLPLASAGTLRPPHLQTTIYTQFKSKLTPIDN